MPSAEIFNWINTFSLLAVIALGYTTLLTVMPQKRSIIYIYIYIKREKETGRRETEKRRGEERKKSAGLKFLRHVTLLMRTLSQCGGR